MKRIPTLDGWRGIAIAFVLFDHIQYSTGGYIFRGANTGQHGVTIFFVLSGYLITRNLIGAGRIDLKKFYIRRFFRLMPVVWLYLAILFSISCFTGVHLLQWSVVKLCLLFCRNYAGATHGFFTGHFWSLSIEEQFYLVWPCLLLIFNPRRCRWIAAAAVVGIAIYRWRHWQHYQQHLFAFRTEVRADALFIGCLLALLLSDPTFCQRAADWSKWLAIPAIVVFLFSVSKFGYTVPAYESASIAVLMTAAMLHPSSIPSRLLSWKPLVWLGQVSYSVYVWQEPFMWFKGGRFGFVFLLVIFMPLFALGSYYLIERPCTQFGRRLTAGNRAPQVAEPRSVAI